MEPQPECVTVCMKGHRVYLKVTFSDGYEINSDLITYAFSVPWFRGSARSCHFIL